MSAKQATGLALVVAPAVGWAALHLRAQAFMETWDLRPGAPEAPLLQRLVVFLDNWAIRIAPFAALLLVAAPVVALALGRRLAVTAPARHLRVDAVVWTSLAAFLYVSTLGLESQLVDGSLLILWAVLNWVTCCICALALANTYAVIAVGARLSSFKNKVIIVSCILFLVAGIPAVLATLVAALAMDSLLSEPTRAAV